MASSRPPSGPTGGAPNLRIPVDLSALRAMPNVAHEASQATAREISQAFRALQNEQRVALEQARQATVIQRQELAQVTGLQTRLTTAVKTESQVRIQQARAESVAQQQQARAAASTRIEEERRITAQVRSELRAREAAQRSTLSASQVGGGGGLGGGSGLARFAGAALGSSIGGPLGGIAGGLAGGSLPVAAGVAVGQFVRVSVEASKAAVAYERQSLAARSLAGSQERLNELLAAYERATGGAIGEAKALADVTNLQAIGFAKDAGELERFVRAARGISIAKGTDLAGTVNELALGIANQSTRRFDQLGLSVAEVNDRIDELREKNKSLNRESAFREAVLQVATEKYGELTKAAEAQATGLEELSKAWDDFSLDLGQAAQGPINGAAHALANLINTVRSGLEELSRTGQTSTVRGGISIRGNAEGARNILAGLTAARERVLADMESGARPAAVLQADLAELDAKIKAVNVSLGTLDTTARNATFGSRTTIGRVTPTKGGFSGEQLEAQTTAKVNRFLALNDIQRNEVNAVLDIERQTGRQRASIISNYEKSIVREAEDFARQRANAERKLQMSILDVAQDSARQRAKWEAELARNIADARADSAERVAEIDRNFAREQEKRARAFRDSIMDAAGRLDAKAVAEAQRNFLREQQDAQEAHDERLEDEARSLEKSIQQQREANQRRIDEQAENDRLRIEEMKAAFEEQKRQEDVERGIRLQRQADDHDAQLTELDRQHDERIQQIKDHAAKERQQVEDEFQDAMIQAGVHLKAREAYLKQLEKLAEDSFDRTYNHMLSRFAAPVQGPQTGPVTRITPGTPAYGAPARNFPSLANPYQYVPPVPTAGMSSTGGLTVGTIAPTVVIGDTGGRSDEYILGLVRQGILMALQEAAA